MSVRTTNVKDSDQITQKCVHRARNQGDQEIMCPDPDQKGAAGKRDKIKSCLILHLCDHIFMVTPKVSSNSCCKVTVKT